MGLTRPGIGGSPAVCRNQTKISKKKKSGLVGFRSTKMT